MKVAFIHPDLGIGGAERLVLDVAEALNSQLIDIVFITNHFDEQHAFEELCSEKYPVRVIGDWIPRSFFGIFQAFFAYIRMLYLAIVYLFFYKKEDEPDLFFVDQIPMANFILKLSKCKIIYYCHHPDLLATPRTNLLKKVYRAPIDWIEERGTALADVILVNSKYTESVFAKTFKSIRKPVHVLYPTIASSYLDIINTTTRKLISDLATEIKYNRNDVIFLSVNRYHPAKGLELAINAMECLGSILNDEEWQRVYLIITGGYDPRSNINKEYYRKLVQLAMAKDLSHKIVFFKSPNDYLKADLIMASDCLLYTPVNEHFGIVPLEAMAAEKPVIACNSGGPCETIIHDKTGLLTPPEPLAMAECMKKIMDLKYAQKIGRAGREHLIKNFSYDAFKKNILKVVMLVNSQNKGRRVN